MLDAAKAQKRFAWMRDLWARWPGPLTSVEVASCGIRVEIQAAYELAQGALRLLSQPVERRVKGRRPCAMRAPLRGGPSLQG